MIKYALAYLRPIFFELARKDSFEKSWHPPEALILFSRCLNSHFNGLLVFILTYLLILTTTE